MTTPSGVLPPPPVVVDTPLSATPSLWDRVSNWASENKAVVYTFGAVAVVVTGAGVVYYLSQPPRQTPDAEKPLGTTEEKRKSKKERRKGKKHVEESKREEKATPAESERCKNAISGTSMLPPSDLMAATAAATTTEKTVPAVKVEEPLPEVDEETVEKLSAQVSCMEVT